MDEVKVTKDFTKSELWAFVNEVNRLMIDLNLTEREVVGLLKITAGFAADFTPMESLSLNAQGLLIDLTTVSDKFLDSGKTPKQTSLDLIHESKPRTSDTAIKLVDNIAQKLLPLDEKENDKEILSLARKSFDNDLTQARYYYILKHIYPPLLIHEQNTHPRWREHFIVPPPIYTRWYANASYTKKFKQYYVSPSVDICLFILANYFYMKESIDLKKDITYCTTNMEFAKVYHPWYDYAKTHVEEVVKKTEKRAKKPLVKRTNKTDTL